MKFIITRLQYQKRSTYILTLAKKLMITILKIKLVILLEYQHIKIYVEKFTLQIGLNKFS